MDHIQKQQELNCAFFVDFLNRSLIQIVPRSLRWLEEIDDAGNLSSAIAAETQTFYGEFDSGSERTLAAWIRHASRTGFNL